MKKPEMEQDKQALALLQSSKQSSLEIKTSHRLTMTDIKRKAKEKLDTSLTVAGYVLYFWNTDKLNAQLKTLPYVANPLTIKSTQEDFLLGEPAFMLGDKPVFIVLRGIPYSIELELIKSDDREVEIDGQLYKLKELDYTPSQIYAKTKSLYHHIFFKSKRLTLTDKVIFILSIVLTALLTSIIFMLVG